MSFNSFFLSLTGICLVFLNPAAVLAEEILLPPDLPVLQRLTLIATAKAPPSRSSRNSRFRCPSFSLRPGEGFRYSRVEGQWRIGPNHAPTGPKGGSERFRNNIALASAPLGRLCVECESDGRYSYSTYNEGCDASKGGRNFIYNNTSSRWHVSFFCNDRENGYQNNSGALNLYIDVFDAEGPAREPESTVPDGPTPERNRKPRLTSVNALPFRYSMQLSDTFTYSDPDNDPVRKLRFNSLTPDIVRLTLRGSQVDGPLEIEASERTQVSIRQLRSGDSVISVEAFDGHYWSDALNVFYHSERSSISH